MRPCAGNTRHREALCNCVIIQDRVSGVGQESMLDYLFALLASAVEAISGRLSTRFAALYRDSLQ